MLYEQITQKMKDAMKESREFELGIYRLLISALKNKEIEKRTKGGELPLTEEEVLEVLSKEAKKRKESAEIFATGNRQDLADKELKELEIIKTFLPEELSDEELQNIIKEAITKIGASNAADFGKVMKEVMAVAKGRADSAKVQTIIKNQLG